MKFNLNDRPGFFPMLMYGLQWWIVSIPCVVIIGIIVARLHYTDQVEQIFYMQKLFGIMGLAMIVQMLWGHRLPLVIGPASVLLIGILSTVSIGVEGIYTSLMIGGGILTLLAFSGLLSRLQAVFTPRIIVVILCLIAFTLSPVILRLIFAGNSFVLFHLFFALLLALAMILANKLLKGIWKSIVVLGGILVGSMVYYSVMGFPETGGIQAGHEGYFGLWSWKFDLGAVLSFFFCFIALIVNELGSIQAVGRMIGADHMERRTTRGVGITGLANVVSGALGIVGPVDYSMSPGIIAATGCASRFPLIPAGIGLVVCAFFPGFIECLNAIPGVVMGAVLLYLMASQLSAGMQMMIREKAVDGFDGGIVVGFSLMVALLVSFAPDEALNSIPALIRPIVGNGFVMGVITVLILEHLIFRAGKKAKKE